MEEKLCKVCGRTLPVSEFSISRKSKDGYQNYCKEYSKEYHKKNYVSKKQVNDSAKKLLKMYTNPELAKFQPRELIAELRARGYSGELQYTQRIMV